MRHHLRYWGAVYIIGALFIASLIGQFVFQIVLEGESLAAFGIGVFENWQSEFLQLCVDAILLLALKHHIFRADAEDLERIESKLDELLDSHGEQR